MTADDTPADHRAKLQANLERAALDLLDFTATAAALVPVKGTSPQVYIVVGDAEQIKGLMRGVR